MSRVTCVIYIQINHKYLRWQSQTKDATYTRVYTITLGKCTPKSSTETTFFDFPLHRWDSSCISLSRRWSSSTQVWIPVAEVFHSSRNKLLAVLKFQALCPASTQSAVMAIKPNWLLFVFPLTHLACGHSAVHRRNQEDKVAISPKNF